MKIYINSGGYKEIVTETEAAELLGIKKATLSAYRGRNQSNLTSFKISGNVYFLLEDIMNRKGDPFKKIDEISKEYLPLFKKHGYLLKERQQTIMKERLIHKKTLEQIGEELRLTKQRVLQLEQLAFWRLKSLDKK